MSATSVNKAVVFIIDDLKYASEKHSIDHLPYLSRDRFNIFSVVLCCFDVIFVLQIVLFSHL